MLSRIANNLFWMGRYLERAEITARYTKVNYFSALDAPESISKEIVLDSICRMNGCQLENKKEREVLLFVAFDKSNSNSIASCVQLARENARGARDELSTEVWESINKYYHFTNNYDQDLYVKTHLYDFTQSVIEQTVVIKGRVDSTLLHNEVWSIIRMGILLERAIQIVRAIQNKLIDIDLLSDKEDSGSLTSYQLATLLRSLESFDMSRKFYKKPPTLSNSLEFLLLNEDFPHSFLSCWRKLKSHLNKVSILKKPVRGSAEYFANRSYAEMQYLGVDEVENDLQSNLNTYLNNSYKIASDLEKEYFSY